jgi:hypothetical protein
VADVNTERHILFVQQSLHFVDVLENNRNAASAALPMA